MSTLSVFCIASLDSNQRSRVSQILAVLRRREIIIEELNQTMYVVEDCNDRVPECKAAFQDLVELTASHLKEDSTEIGISREFSYMRIGNEVVLNIGCIIDHLGGQGLIQTQDYTHIIDAVSRAIVGHAETWNLVVQMDYLAHLKFYLKFKSHQNQAKFLKNIYEQDLGVGLEFNPSQPLEHYFQIEQFELPQLAKIILEEKRGYKSGQGDESDVSRVQAIEFGYLPLLPMTLKEYLTEMNKQLIASDIFAIKWEWQNDLPSLLTSMAQNWELYRCEYGQLIKQFICRNMLKVFKIGLYSSNSQDSYNQSYGFKEYADIYEMVYPRMQQVIASFRTRLGIGTFQEEFLRYRQTFSNRKTSDQQSRTMTTATWSQIIDEDSEMESEKETLTNRLFFYFIEEKKIEANQKDKIKVGIVNRVGGRLKEEIAYSIDFYNTFSHWSDLFNTVASYFQCLSNQKEQTPSPQQLFYQNIEEERLVNNRCLGCSKFFYYKLNIYDESVARFKLIIFPSVRKSKEREAAIKNQICAMLNSGGGIILFDCLREYRSILPVGQVLSEMDKEEYEQRIQSYMKAFYPKLKINSQVTVSFVPIVDLKSFERGRERYTGEEYLLKEAYMYAKHKYLEGVYVTRIKVVSLDPTLVYSWEQREGNYQNECIVSSPSNVLSTLSARAKTKFIKRKMKQYIPDCFDQESRRLLRNPTSFLQHECQKCEIGAISNKRANNKLEKREIIEDFQQGYKQMCLVITKRKNFQKMKEILNQNGIKCDIKSYFQQYHFKQAEKASVLYHNCKFEDLARVCELPSLQTKNKSPILISVTAFLKFSKRDGYFKLSDNDCGQFSKYLWKEFPTDWFRAYQYHTDNNDKEYYCEATSRLSTVFLYFYLNEMNEKVKLRNPPQLEFMSNEERRCRFVLIFDSKGYQRKLDKIKQQQKINHQSLDSLHVLPQPPVQPKNLFPTYWRTQS